MFNEDVRKFAEAMDPAFAKECERKPGGDIHWCMPHKSIWPEVPDGMEDVCLFLQVMHTVAEFAWEPSLLHAIKVQTMLSMWMVHIVPDKIRES